MKLSLGMGIDPELTARDNIYVNGTIIGLTFKEIGRIFNEIIEFAGLEKFVDVAVKFYSKGMKQRLVFSIAIHAKSDIFLLDEFFGGTGDEDFRIKSNEAFKSYVIEGNTIIIVSHQPKIIQQHCDRVYWISKGSIKMHGPAQEVVQAYRAHAKKQRGHA